MNLCLPMRTVCYSMLMVPCFFMGCRSQRVTTGHTEESLNLSEVALYGATIDVPCESLEISGVKVKGVQGKPVKIQVQGCKERQAEFSRLQNDSVADSRGCTAESVGDGPSWFHKCKAIVMAALVGIVVGVAFMKKR